MLVLQPRLPLPRIRHFGEAGIGVLPVSIGIADHRPRQIKSGPNLAETKHWIEEGTIETVSLKDNKTMLAVGDEPEILAYYLRR